MDQKSSEQLLKDSSNEGLQLKVRSKLLLSILNSQNEFNSKLGELISSISNLIKEVQNVSVTRLSLKSHYKT